MSKVMFALSQQRKGEDLIGRSIHTDSGEGTFLCMPSVQHTGLAEKKGKGVNTGLCPRRCLP